MGFGVTLFVIVGLIAVIWLLIEVKRMRHKVFAIFLISLILLTYFSFLTVFKDSGVDYKSVDGLINAGGLYFSWLGSIFGNVRTITTNAIKMNWETNSTSGG
jgi:hypothetical protein